MMPDGHTIDAIIRQHVALEVRCIHRVHLHAHTPMLQTTRASAIFFTNIVAPRASDPNSV